ncbi:MAG TPA: ATP-binding protein [Caldisericia bacterium]|nr:ATP-binding protein [Caldisericia bacterium]
MKSNKQSISKRMMILFLFTVIIPVAMMGIVFYQYMTDSLQQEIMLYSDSVMNEKNEFFDLLISNITHISSSMMQHDDMPKAIQELQQSQNIKNLESFHSIDRLQQTFSELQEQQGVRKLQLLRLDGSGIEFYGNYKKACAVNQIFMRHFNFQEIKNPQHLQWFWNANDATENNEQLIAWLPLLDSSKVKTQGYLLFYIDMIYLHSKFKGEQRYGQYYAVVDENLQILYHPEEKRIGTILLADDFSNIIEKGSKLLYDFNHELSIVSYSCFKSTNWSFLSFIPYQYIHDRTFGILSTTFGLVFLLLILAIMFGLFLSTYYLVPLNKITQHFKNFQLGIPNPDLNLSERGNNEISELTKWYKLFFSNLKEKEVIDKKLSKKQKEYHQLVNSIREVLFRMNQHGDLVFLNKAWEEITSYSIDEALENSLISFVHPDDHAQFSYALDTLIREKSELKTVVRFIKPDQRQGWMEIIARVDETDEDNKEALISGIMIDITEQKELDVLKDNFINAVCHEIKTPFTSFKQGIQILIDSEQEAISKDEKTYVFETLNKNIFRLQRLLDDLFIFKDFEDGQESYIIKADNLNNLVEQIVEEMRPHAESKKLSLDLSKDPMLEEIEFDRDKVARALKNLLDNAIKYTHQGGIKVSTKLDQNKALVSVQDTGIGINEEDFSKLFQQFSQLSCGLNRTTGGTGLGLVIAKKIMEQHQGTIRLQSEAQKGSCFTMEFPYTPVGKA